MIFWNFIFEMIKIKGIWGKSFILGRIKNKMEKFGELSIKTYIF